MVWNTKKKRYRFIWQSETSFFVGPASGNRRFPRAAAAALQRAKPFVFSESLICCGISLSRTREITGICWEFGFHVLGEFGLFRNTDRTGGALNVIRNDHFTRELLAGEIPIFWICQLAYCLNFMDDAHSKEYAALGTELLFLSRHHVKQQIDNFLHLGNPIHRGLRTAWPITYKLEKCMYFRSISPELCAVSRPATTTKKGEAFMKPW